MLYKVFKQFFIPLYQVTSIFIYSCNMLKNKFVETNTHLGYFRSLIQNECTIDVELKMNVVLSGKLKFVDHNMLMELQMEEKEREKLPKKFKNFGTNVFIRGSGFRKIGMPKIEKEVRLIVQSAHKK